MSDGAIAGKIPTGSVTGSVAAAQVLTGQLLQKGRMTGKLTTAYVTNASAYVGPYEVTPKVEGQELKTRQRYMNANVTVHPIPFFEVSNTSGGSTVYIADETEME